MAENEQTKVCPLCAETIKAAAKVCPHCHKIQKRWLFITQYDLLGIVTLLLVVGTVWILVKLFAEGRSFSSSRDKITVLSSQLAVDANSDDTNVVVSGILTNASNYAWNTKEFEVRFYDSSGKIVDTGSGEDGFTVLPHSDHSFQITLYSRKSIPEHSSRKVILRSAGDPDAWFN